LHDDSSLRERVLAGQRARLGAFSPDTLRATLKDAIDRVTGS